MVLTATVVFMVAFVAAPQRGLLARRAAARRAV